MHDKVQQWLWPEFHNQCVSADLALVQTSQPSVKIDQSSC